MTDTVEANAADIAAMTPQWSWRKLIIDSAVGIWGGFSVWVGVGVCIEVDDAVSVIVAVGVIVDVMDETVEGLTVDSPATDVVGAGSQVTSSKKLKHTPTPQVRAKEAILFVSLDWMYLTGPTYWSCHHLNWTIQWQAA